MRVTVSIRQFVAMTVVGVALGFAPGIVDSVSAATILATTADGNGADTHLSNDGQQAQTTTHGGAATNDVRAIQDTRARIGMLRFDLSNVGDLAAEMKMQQLDAFGHPRFLELFHG